VRTPAPRRFPWPGRDGCPRIAVDGKAVRGAAGPDGLIPYLLAAATYGTGAVLAERLIGPKTSEVPEFAPLLRELDEYCCLAGHRDALGSKPGSRGSSAGSGGNPEMLAEPTAGGWVLSAFTRRSPTNRSKAS
jgi:hypothetical protein